MGMAASQCRLLLLTARKSDLELRSMLLSNQKMILALQTADIAEDYTKALQNTRTCFNWGQDSNGQLIQTELTYDELLSTYNYDIVPQYRLVDCEGNIVVADEADVTPGMNTDGRQINPIGNIIRNKEFFLNALKQGNLRLQKMVYDYEDQVNEDGTTERVYAETGNWKYQSLTGNADFSEESDDSDDDLAQAQYQSRMARVQAAEKIIDTQLKQIETQQSACQTEIQSVEGLLKKNVQEGFKLFSSS